MHEIQENPLSAIAGLAEGELAHLRTLVAKILPCYTQELGAACVFIFLEHGITSIQTLNSDAVTTRVLLNTATDLMNMNSYPNESVRH